MYTKFDEIINDMEGFLDYLDECFDVIDEENDQCCSVKECNK